MYKTLYKNFNDYLRDRWEIARRTAYQWIGATAVVDTLQQAGINIFPQNEAQARPLTRLTPIDQVKVWRIVLEEAQGNITAKLLKHYWPISYSHLPKKRRNFNIYFCVM